MLYGVTRYKYEFTEGPLELISKTQARSSCPYTNDADRPFMVYSFSWVRIHGITHSVSANLHE